MNKKKNSKRWYRNKTVKASVKTAIGETNDAISKKDSDAASSSVLKTMRQLDKAASKGVIHKNNAARKKSRLMRKTNVLSQT